MQILVKTEVCDGEIFSRYSGNIDVSSRKMNAFKISSIYNSWYSLAGGVWVYFDGFFSFSFCAGSGFIFWFGLLWW